MPAMKIALAAEDVRRAAAEQQEAAEQQRVGVDDPLQVGLAEVQILLDRRQRDVHDRRVEDHHELGEADEDQRHPAVVFASQPSRGGMRNRSSVPVPVARLRGSKLRPAYVLLSDVIRRSRRSGTARRPGVRDRGGRRRSATTGERSAAKVRHAEVARRRCRHAQPRVVARARDIAARPAARSCASPHETTDDASAVTHLSGRPRRLRRGAHASASIAASHERYYV